MPRFQIPQKDGHLCVGVIAQSHGLRGEILFKPFIENTDILKKGLVLVDLKNNDFEVENARFSNKGIIIKFKNILNRNDADAVRKTYIFIDTNKLPETEEDEIYYYELVDYKVCLSENDAVLGLVKNVFDNGANTVLEIKLSETNKTVLIPYTNDIIIDIDKNEKIIKLDENLFKIYEDI